MGLDNPLHIAFLVLVLLLLFGAKRIPGMARDLGTGMREFKEGILPGPSTETAPVAEQRQLAPPAAQPPQYAAVPAAESQPPPQQSI